MLIIFLIKPSNVPIKNKLHQERNNKLVVIGLLVYYNIVHYHHFMHNDLKHYLVDDFTRPLKFLESLLAIATRGPNAKVPSVPKV